MNLTKTQTQTQTQTPVVVPTMVSPLGKACSRMDLTAVHDILLKTGYKDEEGAENEVRRSDLITSITAVHDIFPTFRLFKSDTHL